MFLTSMADPYGTFALEAQTQPQAGWPVPRLGGVAFVLC